MAKSKRTGLTEFNVFNKPKYRTIMLLINHTVKQKIRFYHLNLALVKKNRTEYEEKIIKNFFFTDFDRKLLKEIDKAYKTKKINYEEYVKAKKLHKQNFLDRLKLRFPKDNITFRSIYGLRKALKNLKDLEIIKSLKPKDGYSYYIFTDKGLALFTKWQIHYSIDNFVPNNFNYLVVISNFILECIFYDKLKKK